MIRLGLCCIFAEEPIKFRTTTATSLNKLSRRERLEKLAGLCRQNAESLLAALGYCASNGIGCFRVNSQILPLKTHPDLGYELTSLPDGESIRAEFESCGEFAAEHNLRTAFHPDQFVVLNSPREDVVRSSIDELEYQAEVATWINADVINIHGGGAYGDKATALARWPKSFKRLSKSVRERLTVENDDRTYTPGDLLPLCDAIGIPLVYDVHHHRCNGDGLSTEEASELALATWNREPLFHISSPRDGWKSPQPARHHDYINVRDFPRCWEASHITVEVEAKAKELAVKRLAKGLARRGVQVRARH